MQLSPGEIVDGKYRVERKLGAGGMGAVFAARHLELGELVAIKVLLATVEGSSASNRFQREARAAGRLKGEHIVRVLDAGRFVDGAPYIVFEYIEGLDLRGVLDERGALPVREAVEIILQACEGVAEAHLLGMVHRDLSLKNILLTKRPNGRPLVKILDFGVVKVTNAPNEDTMSVTPTAMDVLVGSARYMAPEQIQMSSKVDARADVWSLGVCLYTLLGGEHPFDGNTVAEILAAVTARPPTPIRELRPDLPEPIADAVERALEKHLTRRFQSVTDLAAALGAAIGDEDAALRVAGVLDAPPPRARETPPPAALPAIEPTTTTVEAVIVAPAPLAPDTVTLEIPRTAATNAPPPPAAPQRPATQPRSAVWPMLPIAVALLVAAIVLFVATRPRAARDEPVGEEDASAAVAPSPDAETPLEPDEVPPPSVASHAVPPSRPSTSGATRPHEKRTNAGDHGAERPKPRPTASQRGPYDRL